MSRVGLGLRIAVFLFAFVIVIYGYVMRFDLGKYNRFYLLTGDYATLAIAVLLSIAVGMALQWLLVFLYQLEFERSMQARRRRK